MAWTLPTTFMDSCDGFAYCLAKWAYSVTNGIFWCFTTLAFMISMYVATQSFGNARSYGFASGVGLLLAIFFAIMQLMPWWFASLLIINGCIGVTAMILNER